MPAVIRPARGDLWLANLDPPKGHEQGGTRPVLVVSVDRFNQSGFGLVVAAPLTSRLKNFPTHIEIQPPEGGIKIPSFIKCEDIRSISAERLIRRIGKVAPSTMQQVGSRLQMILGI